MEFEEGDLEELVDIKMMINGVQVKSKLRQTDQPGDGSCRSTSSGMARCRVVSLGGER